MKAIALLSILAANLMCASVLASVGPGLQYQIISRDDWLGVDISFYADSAHGRFFGDSIAGEQPEFTLNITARHTKFNSRNQDVANELDEEQMPTYTIDTTCWEGLQHTHGTQEWEKIQVCYQASMGRILYHYPKTESEMHGVVDCRKVYPWQYRKQQASSDAQSND